MDGEDHILPVAFAILDSEDQSNMRWVLEQLLLAAEETPEDGFKAWLEGKMAHFMDRGPAWTVAKGVLPEHEPQCVSVYIFVCVCC